MGRSNESVLREFALILHNRITTKGSIGPIPYMEQTKSHSPPGNGLEAEMERVNRWTDEAITREGQPLFLVSIMMHWCMDIPATHYGTPEIHS